MIPHLRPYPIYRDSGVLWLGKLPDHWRICRLGELLRERGETNQGRQVAEVLSVLREKGVIPYSEKGNIGNKKSEDITRYKIVRPDDIVVNCMNVIIGSVGLSRYTGCLSPVYYVLKRRSECDCPSYLNAYFQTKQFQDSLVRIGNGILAHRMRIPMELLKCEPFPYPPPEEQIKIAQFLEYVDHHFRHYRNSKRRLIELLEEQKQTIVQHAVTRGLDPNARLKCSGFKWLDEVPDHWRVQRLKSLMRNIVEQTSEKQGAELYIAMEHVESWTGRLRITGQDVPFDGQVKRFRPGDILFGKLRPYLAKVTRSQTHGVCVGEFLVLRSHSPDTVAQYWEYLLRSKPIIDAINSSTAGAKMPRTDWQSVGGLAIVCPTLAEQAAIASFLDRKTADIEALIRSTQRQISLMQEYRTRLISDVVTGKLDVREAAAQLPKQLSETGSADAAYAPPHMSTGSDRDSDASTEECEP